MATRRQFSADFAASSYDALVDAPAEAGKFDSFDFTSEGAHFRVVVDGTGWNKSSLEDYLRKITEYELSLMGGPPFTEYTFFFHIGNMPMWAAVEWSIPFPPPSRRI